jgi:hypothetical protein
METNGPLRPADAAIARAKQQLIGLIRAAHRAAQRRDPTGLARAVAALVPLVSEALTIDLTAIIDLAPRDLELATTRWSHLSKLLA